MFSPDPYGRYPFWPDSLFARLKKFFHSPHKTTSVNKTEMETNIFMNGSKGVKDEKIPYKSEERQQVSIQINIHQQMDEIWVLS